MKSNGSGNNRGNSGHNGIGGTGFEFTGPEEEKEEEEASTRAATAAAAAGGGGASSGSNPGKANGNGGGANGSSGSKKVACTNWSNGISFEQLSVDTFKTRVQEMLNQNTGGCANDLETEIEALLPQKYIATLSSSGSSSSSNIDRALAKFINDLNTDAIQTSIPMSTFVDDVGPTKNNGGRGLFDNNFMTEYIYGGTFLNSETGNFQNADGTDPRLNTYYPTSEESYQAGVAINNFYNTKAETTLLGPIAKEMETCSTNAIMCCFGRDRQSGDNNGNCNLPENGGCGSESDPADNTNYCYTKDPLKSFPGESENDIHCHGIAWGDIEIGFEYHARFNNLYYVSLYDHMYSRGYVEPAVSSESVCDVPMCSCIEKMNPVTRSDCTQIDVVKSNVVVSSSSGGSQFSAEYTEFEFEFNSCKGILANGNANNNDLASYANRLVHDGKMSNGMRSKIFDILVGSDNPQDNENEAACERAYAEFTGNNQPYTFTGYDVELFENAIACKGLTNN